MSADAPSLFWAVNPHLTRRHFHARLSLAGLGEGSRADSSASIRQGSITPVTDIDVAWGMRSQPNGTYWHRRTSSGQDSTAATQIQKRANIGSFWNTWMAACGSES